MTIALDFEVFFFIILLLREMKIPNDPVPANKRITPTNKKKLLIINPIKKTSNM